MSNEEKKDFFQTAFDGLGEKIANRFNQRLRDIAPRAVDWLVDFLLNHGAEKYKSIKEKYNKENPTPALSLNKNSSNSVADLDCAIKNYKSNVCENELRIELLEAVTDEISNDYEMWKQLSGFIQEVKCPHCGESILDNWFDYVANESQSECNMGMEVFYSIECDNYRCPRCKRIFEVKGYIRTYPDGIYDSHDLKTSAS